MTLASTQCRRALFIFSTSPHHQQPQHITKLLRSCTAVSDLHRIHAAMIKTGIDLLPFPAAKLLASAALLDFDHAFSLFRLLPSPTLFSFNSILRAHSLAPDPNLQETLSIFNSIRARALSLDQFSFITALKVCSRILAIATGEQLHCLVAKAGFDYFLNLRNMLLHFYCVCGRVADAQQLFDQLPHIKDAVSFSTLMGGYLRISQPGKVVAFLRDMFYCSMELSPAIIVTAFSAFIDGNYSGEPLHGYCVKSGLSTEPNVSTAVATMYTKDGMMELARKVFDEMTNRDVVIYNCIMDGYAKEGSLDDCLVLLQKMKGDGVNSNAATLLGPLAACASSGALSIGRHIHGYAKEEKLEIQASLGTALVDMYVKNGCLEEAILVFNQMQDRDVKAWTAMIMGFAVHGRSEEALRLFDEMEESGVRPNEVTLLAVLSACSHGGLLGLGKDYFKRVVLEYRLCPGIKHYGCIIDLLGRAGFLQEAYELVKSLPYGGDAMAWRALLAASRVHGEIRIGKLARETLAAMGEEHPTDSILLSSSYAYAGRWEEARKVMDLELVGEETMSKVAGCSSIEMAGF
ncbi:pentatricopeptide repeat-containing protein At1g26900, mitochondrial [Dendrobium catenatum]|uniref:Pentatricopeptide repeat-containing protein n=1 Tax=Dendrobium catenatum TaxID=906689 RepID=A0A2I0VCV9_9ASPA|nr:pentatricopeptide repeat-containing protein At1g26900, mitochondrial [Dendrobium catenatum]PKU61238.1 Pentatricopeptide repeat-containing protein [Dendrobium catenatum]